MKWTQYDFICISIDVYLLLNRYGTCDCRVQILHLVRVSDISFQTNINDHKELPRAIIWL